MADFAIGTRRPKNPRPDFESPKCPLSNEYKFVEVIPSRLEVLGRFFKFSASGTSRRKSLKNRPCGRDVFIFTVFTKTAQNRVSNFSKPLLHESNFFPIFEPWKCVYGCLAFFTCRFGGPALTHFGGWRPFQAHFLLTAAILEIFVWRIYKKP